MRLHIYTDTQASETANDKNADHDDDYYDNSAHQREVRYATPNDYDHATAADYSSLPAMRPNYRVVSSWEGGECTRRRAGGELCAFSLQSYVIFPFRSRYVTTTAATAVVIRSCLFPRYISFYIVYFPPLAMPNNSSARQLRWEEMTREAVAQHAKHNFLLARKARWSQARKAR